MAEIVTRVMRAKDFVRHFAEFKRDRYWDAGWPHLSPPLPPARETYEQLIALGDNPDPDEVERIAGRPISVTLGTCDGCGANVPTTIQFDVNCGEYGIDVCAECCDRFAAMIRET